MHDVTPVQHLLVLEVESGPNAATRFELMPGVSTIGRRPDNTMVIHDPWASGRHGQVEISTGAATYTDLGSRHGSSIERGGTVRPVHGPIDLKDGDVIILGRTRMRAHVVDAWWRFERSTDISPPPLLTSIVSSDYQSVESLERLITESDDRLAVVFALGEELASASCRSRVVDLAARAIFDAMDVVDRVTAVWMDPELAGLDDERVERRTRSAAGTQDAPPVTGDPSLPLVLRAVTSRQSMLVVADDDARTGEPTASVCVPLIVDDTTLGALQVDAMQPTARLDTSDVELLAVLAHSIAGAVDRIGRAANLRQLFESFVEASTLAIEQRDPATAGHSHRVARYAVELLDVVDRTTSGPWADASFTSEERRAFRYAALLHDFGKIAVREPVLTKPRRLYAHRADVLAERAERSRAMYRAERWEALCTSTTSGDTPASVRADIAAWDATIDVGLALIARMDRAGRLDAADVAALDAFVADPRHPLPLLTPADAEALRVTRGTLTPSEWEEMRSHVEHTASFLERIEWGPALRDVPRIAASHHERLDGSGYPHGLDEDALDVRDRILMIADMYDAMTASDRPYRDAVPVTRAIATLRADASAGRLDDALVELFVQHVVPVIGPGASSFADEDDVPVTAGHQQIDSADLTALLDNG